MKFPKINHSKFIFVLLICAFLIKLIYGLYSFDVKISSDAKDYFEYAQLVLEDGIFVPDKDKLEAFAPPGFPWLLALVIFLSGSLYSIVFINAVLSTATIFIIYLISRRVLTGNYVLLPSIWAALYVPYYMYVGNVLKEPLLQFLIPLSVYFLIKLKEKPLWLNIILFSFCYTYSFHTDERYFIFLPVFLVWLIFPLKDYKKTIPLSLLTFFAILLFSLPWAIRNYQVYERPILITERFQSPIDARLGYKTEILERQKYFKYEQEMFLDSLLNGMNPVVDMGRKRAMKKAVEDGLVPHNYSVLEKLKYNTLGYWSPIRTDGILLGSGWKYKGSRSTIVNIFYTLNFGILLPFMIVGLFLTIKKRKLVLIILSSILFIHYLMHVFIIFPSGRYRHPVDFIIIILAVLGLSYIIEAYIFRFSEFWRLLKSDSKGNSN